MGVLGSNTRAARASQPGAVDADAMTTRASPLGASVVDLLADDTTLRRNSSHDAPRETPQRFELVYMVSGAIIENTRISTRIHNATSVKWIHENVAKLVDWPATHVHLVIAGQTFKRPVPRNLMLDRFANGTETLCIGVVREPPPSDFFEWNGLCLCDFGRCCWIGREDVCCHATQNPMTGLWHQHASGPTCRSCGNDGCCRCGNCGHDCCGHDMDFYITKY